MDVYFQFFIADGFVSKCFNVGRRLGSEYCAAQQDSYNDFDERICDFAFHAFLL